jgi:hypothetical protein
MEDVRREGITRRFLAAFRDVVVRQREDDGDNCTLKHGTVFGWGDDVSGNVEGRNRDNTVRRDQSLQCDLGLWVMHRPLFDGERRVDFCKGSNNHLHADLAQKIRNHLQVQQQKRHRLALPQTGRDAVLFSFPGSDQVEIIPSPRYFRCAGSCLRRVAELVDHA